MDLNCKCEFKVVNLLNWKNPKPEDACFGLECKKCKKVISQGLTQKEARKQI